MGLSVGYLHSFNFIFSLKKVWLFETLLLTLHPKKKILGLYRIKDNRTRLHRGDLQAGHFFYKTGMVNQKPHNIEEQIRLLRDKGMNFSDDEERKAKECFSRISYFRLKYYWRDLLDADTDGDFIEGTTFSDVIRRYDFDHQLRLILFDAIEIIEVALRSKVINHMSQAAGNGLWYLDSSLFENSDYHEDFVYDLKYEFGRSTEPFAKEYIDSHPNWDEESFDGDNPDAWRIIEVATFGTLSKMCKNLKSQLPQRSAIANDFGLYSAKDLTGWLEAISLMRNIVAHHSRLWNRTFGKKVTNPRGLRGKWLNSPLTENQKNRPYGFIVAMLYLCNAVCPGNKIKNKILDLISANQNIPYQRLGFIGNWKDDPIWR